MAPIGLSGRGPQVRPCRNRPDTDFGSGGHITHPWPKDPVDHKPTLRHGLKLVCWNMDWLADLFAENEEGRAVLKPEDMVVRGPSPANQQGSAPTVAHRLRLIGKAMSDLEPDIVVLLEGPRRSDALASFFQRLGHGEWECHVQRSAFERYPGGPVREAQRCVGLAVRTDTSRFAADPVTLFDADNPASGIVHEATQPFFAEGSRDLATEWYRFQTRPLYAEIRPNVGDPFRILGVHLKSRGFFAGYDWSRWLIQAEINRGMFAALAQRLRERFLDPYLLDPETRDIPLVVTGGLNEGPGAQVHHPQGRLSSAEMLMGTVWAPELALGNALFDAVGSEYSAPNTFRDIWTMKFPDPISERVQHRAWVDHILYSRNGPDGWCAGATIPRATLGGIPFDAISDHFPVTARIDTSMTGRRGTGG